MTGKTPSLVQYLKLSTKFIWGKFPESKDLIAAQVRDLVTLVINLACATTAKLPSTIALACLPEQQPQRTQSKELKLPLEELLSVFLFLSRMWPCIFFSQKNSVFQSPACLPCADRLLEASPRLNEGTAKILLSASLLRERGNTPKRRAHGGPSREQPAKTSYKTAKLNLLPTNSCSPASSNKAKSPHPMLPRGFTWYLLLRDFLLEKVMVSQSGDLKELKGESSPCLQLYLLSYKASQCSPKLATKFQLRMTHLRCCFSGILWKT